MRGFRRKAKPIIVDDEEYHWGKKRRGLRVLLWLIALASIAALVLIYLASPV